MIIEQFEGMIPQVDPARLNAGLAVDASNAGFDRGALTPHPIGFAVRQYSDLMAGTTGALTRAGGLFYSHMADGWFAFNDTVRRGVDSLISPQDVYRRIYFADSTGPRYLIGDNYTNEAVNLEPVSYRLGVPTPVAAPIATKVSETTPSNLSSADIVRQRVVYVFTLVDDLGQEGPPSLASGGVTVPVEYPFKIDVTLPTAGTDLTARPLTAASRKRIYRSATSSSGTDFQFVGEVGLFTGTFRDTVEYGDEGEVIVTDTWYAPPAEIKELDAVASNFLAGFYDNQLCYSEIKVPYAWPYAYRFPLRYQITAIQSTANGLFIGTTGKPYWAFGADPQAAIPQELDYDYACLSRDSVQEVDGFVVYASHDGLVAIDGQQATLITKDIFTTRDWKALDPATIKAFVFEGRYLFFSPTTGELYSIAPTAPRTMTRVTWGSEFDGVFTNIVTVAHDRRHDRAVLVAGGTAPNLVEVTRAPQTRTTWTSPVVQGAPRQFGLAQVVASDYPVDLTLRSGGREVTMTATSREVFRLPSWPRSRDWQIELAFDSEGDDRRAIYRAALAGSATELTHGA